MKTLNEFNIWIREIEEDIEKFSKEIRNSDGIFSENSMVLEAMISNLYRAWCKINNVSFEINYILNRDEEK